LELALDNLDADVHSRGARMPDYIVKDFLENREEVTQLSGVWPPCSSPTGNLASRSAAS
jgi:hypothetical protein